MENQIKIDNLQFYFKTARQLHMYICIYMLTTLQFESHITRVCVCVNLTETVKLQVCGYKNLFNDHLLQQAVKSIKIAIIIYNFMYMQACKLYTYTYKSMLVAYERRAPT